MAGTIDTAAKRAKLAVRKNPYWQGIGGGRGGLSLGYRRAAKGNGSWVAKVVIDRRRVEERIGIADDAGAAAGALNYATAVAAALEWGKQQAVSIQHIVTAEADAQVPSVRLAIETYMLARRTQAGKKGTENCLARFVLSHSIADVRLARLTAEDIINWRDQLPNTRTPSSKNRLMADLRAALNAAATKYRRELPAHIIADIKVGTKASVVTASPRRQLLSDEQVRSVVEAAYEVDPDEDFGRLVLLAAATGVRFCQIAALTVADVQVKNARLMMPGSKKGKNRTPGPPVPIPVSPDVIEKLMPAIAGRKGSEPLLLRWGYREATQICRWAKDKRQPWKRAYEVLEQWKKVVQISGVPADTVMYALRHSSIVRVLLKGMPIRMVAALHDTSVEMIEKHYAAFITDMSEELARGVTMSFGPTILQAAE